MSEVEGKTHRTGSIHVEILQHADEFRKDPHRADDGHLIRPATFENMSDEDYHALGRAAVWKVDLVVMPALIIIYIMNYLDRQNIAAAKLADIAVDLHLSTTQYQTCVSILFVGYILMQIPSNMIISKIKSPNRYICVVMAIWGVISACMGAVKSNAGLLLARFFIGFVEAAFFPGALFYLSLFYNRKQFALRSALLYSGSQLGNAFGGLLAIAILKLDGKHGIEGWRWLFIIEGVATIGLAMLFFFILPPSISRMKSGLNEIEREWLLWNMESDSGQQDDAKEITVMQGLKMAVSDPKTWLLLITLYMIYIAAAVVNFFPSVVKTLGYSRNITYVLTAPPYLLCVVCMLVNGWHSDKTRDRYFHIVGPLLITIVANVIAVSTLNTGARYTAMMLMPGSFYSASTVLLSWVTGSLAQPRVKRATAIALINCVCNTPNIWTSYLYSTPPRYLNAFATNIAAAVLAVVFATATRFYLARQNRKMDGDVDIGSNGPTIKQIAAGFRYTL